MDDPKTFAAQAARGAKQLLADTGMTDHLRHLAKDVWKGVVDRHEPDELGDTNMSQGVQSVENFKVRAQRRFKHDSREPVVRHWDVPGLAVSTPQNSLMMTLRNAGGFPMRMVGMKTPVVQGRQPQFDTMVDWPNDSKIRHGYAKRNSHVLNGYRSAMDGQDELPGFSGTNLAISDFMWLWAGESLGPATAGWLAVPILGDVPFIAIETLWWDEDDFPASHRGLDEPTGPSFDEREAPVPGLAIKPRAGEGQA